MSYETTSLHQLGRRMQVGNYPSQFVDMNNPQREKMWQENLDFGKLLRKKRNALHFSLTTNGVSCSVRVGKKVKKLSEAAAAAPPPAKKPCKGQDVTAAAAAVTFKIVVFDRLAGMDPGRLCQPNL